MSIILKSGSSSNLADVDTNLALKVALQTAALSGFAAGTSEVDSGSITASRLTRNYDVSPDYRLRVGTDTPMFLHSFVGTVIARDRLQQTLSVMTVVQGTGFLSLNNANALATTNAAHVRTYRTFPLFGNSPLYAEFWLREANETATFATSEWGLGYAATTAAPTDGVMFRRLAGGQLQCVVNFAGVETTSNITGPTATECHHYMIAVYADKTEFWINDVLYASIDTPTNQGNPSNTPELPLYARTYVLGGTASAGRRVELGFLQVSLGDFNHGKPWAEIVAGSGGGSYQVQPGTASGITANYANSAAPASATLSNTAAGYTTLGGQWQFVPVGGAETDYALFGYTNPVGTATLPGKTLHITSIVIGATWVMTTIGANAAIFQWGAAVGSTAVSLATADGDATLAPRRVTLGMQNLPGLSVPGVNSPGFQVNFQTPLVCPPGCLVHIILKLPSMTVTTGLVRGTVMVNGYFE